MTPRLRILAAGLAALGLACADSGPVAPAAPAPQLDVSTANLPAVRIAEFHYDNSGTDAGEAIEVSGPAGTDLTNWQLVLYNGSGGAVYGTTTLSGSIPATCSARGVVVVNYPSNGIQNGSPDGIALVDATGAVVEFLSYEGSFAGVGGAANGLTSVDIGRSENGSEPLGQSLQRDGAGTWSGPIASTFGTCNDDAGPPPPPVASVTVAPSTVNVAAGATAQLTATAFDASNQPIAGVTFTWSSADAAVASVSSTGQVSGVAPGSTSISATSGGVSGTATVTVTPPVGLPSVRITEIHYDNFGTDASEAVEIEGPAGMDLTGWSVVLYNGSGGGPYGTTLLGGSIPATCAPRGVLSIFYPQDGLQNGGPDGIALVDNTGVVVEFLSYEGSMTAVGGPADGLVSTDIGVSESSSPIGQSLQRNALGTWAGPMPATPNLCNGSPPPPPSNVVTFSGRTAFDPALPVGYQDQLFATLRDPNGTTIVTTFTWTSENGNASIDADGVFTALSAGTAVLRATASDGSTAAYALPTRVATASNSASYSGNTEFGDPDDADGSDDLLVRRAEYTASYNPARGTPNWVSYNLEATHFGAEDRCDCFTFDPGLPQNVTRYTTAAYTGAGTFHGYGIDRGHLARSFDRTSGSLDNANTFLFSNIVPQAADQNQGPWAAMENFLGDEARLNNKEVYVIAGVAGSKGTLKDQGLIVIPAHTWKVAVILPRDQGLPFVQRPSDVQVIAVIMPNDPGIRNVDWNTYRTTVDAVEALSGYDLLSLLPDQLEIAVESNTSAPVAAINGPFVLNEGGSVSLSAAGSTDPDNDALTYAWDFGDGTSGSGVTPSHTYVQDGAYTIAVTVTDPRGLTSTVSTTATVANVAPVVAALPAATLLPGETYTANGSFSDPGADVWTATVNYGTGGGAVTLPLSGQTFALSNRYGAAGLFTVTVQVNDDDAFGSATQNVRVLTHAQGIEAAIGMVNSLRAGGKVNPGLASAWRAQLRTARQQLQAGHQLIAKQLLALLKLQVEVAVQAGQIASVDAAPLIDYLGRLIVSL